MKLLALLLLLTSALLAQPSGPILRGLGGRYYLVQCNAQALQPDDPVTILRNGREVASGKVMRQAGSQCSILIQNGQVWPYDLVILDRPCAPQGDRGPALPQACASVPLRRPASAPAPTGSGYFSSFSSTGAVYNLNTGEYLNKP
ncbi:MAG: hypothetical protein U0931_14080 [Vulcanimicrobiota bacterium]